MRAVYPQRQRRDATLFTTVGLGAVLVSAANVVVPDLALFQLGLLLLLAQPALIFRFVLTDLAARAD